MATKKLFFVDKMFNKKFLSMFLHFSQMVGNEQLIYVSHFACINSGLVVDLVGSEVLCSIKQISFICVVRLMNSSILKETQVNYDRFLSYLTRFIATVWAVILTEVVQHQNGALMNDRVG